MKATRVTTTKYRFNAKAGKFTPTEMTIMVQDTVDVPEALTPVPAAKSAVRAETEDESTDDS